MTKLIDISNLNTLQIEPLANKLINTKSIIEKNYLNDHRPFCVAYSGGKDSTAVVYLVLQMLKEVKNQKKIVYILNSNTLAELPPVLEHIKKSLSSIEKFAQKNNLPIKVIEVVPELKNTLNVQLFGVGMPPPSQTLRWCTDKLKVQPIDKKIQELFSNGEFISVLGTRNDEGYKRQERIEQRTVKGTDLKLNDRYPKASNLMPIEHWSTKEVWTYLFEQTNELIDIDFLWKLYSDASNKDASECTFVGAGGKHIDDGKLGCGTSRFGCWQCYLVREKDKSLDGLMQSGYKDLEHYNAFRDWFWKLTQQGWEKTRDVYNHRIHTRDYYDKGSSESEKYHMTMPKGLTLSLRKKAFKKFIELQQKIQEPLITIDECLLIQKRWLLEGDFELSAFKYIKDISFSLSSFSLSKEDRTNLKKAKNIYLLLKNDLFTRKNYTLSTLKRFSIQYAVNSNKIQRQFYPTVKEEKHIRKEWKLLKKLDQNFQEKIELYVIYERLLNERCSK
jgi:DNA sulfur modification protein DndC